MLSREARITIDLATATDIDQEDHAVVLHSIRWETYLALLQDRNAESSQHVLISYMIEGAWNYGACCFTASGGRRTCAPG